MVQTSQAGGQQYLVLTVAAGITVTQRRSAASVHCSDDQRWSEATCASTTKGSKSTTFMTSSASLEPSGHIHQTQAQGGQVQTQTQQFLKGHNKDSKSFSLIVQHNGRTYLVQVRA